MTISQDVEGERAGAMSPDYEAVQRLCRVDTFDYRFIVISMLDGFGTMKMPHDLECVDLDRYPSIEEAASAIVERTEMSMGVRCADCGRRVTDGGLEHQQCIPF